MWNRNLGLTLAISGAVFASWVGLVPTASAADKVVTATPAIQVKSAGDQNAATVQPVNWRYRYWGPYYGYGYPGYYYGPGVVYRPRFYRGYYGPYYGAYTYPAPYNYGYGYSVGYAPSYYGAWW